MVQKPVAAGGGPIEARAREQEVGQVEDVRVSPYPWIVRKMASKSPWMVRMRRSTLPLL